MKRLIQILCFGLTLVTGVGISSFLTLLRSNVSDIHAVSVIEDARSILPIALPKSAPDSAIRRIDFANFTYPSQFIGETGGFKVRNGELLPKRTTEIGLPLDMWLKLLSVTYGDVTGDGAEEAIVDLGWITGGTSMPDLVYIYGLKKGKPELLWAFETGDRADGGYKNVFPENGQLVVELCGKDKIIGRNLYEDDGTHTGACCPIYLTRTRYKWARNRFRPQGKSEILPLDS